MPNTHFLHRHTLARKAFVATAALLLLTAGGLSRPAASGAQSPQVLHVASTMADDLTPVEYALQSGMFKAAGLDVRLTISPTGAAVAEAVISGAADIGKSSLVALMNAHDRGVPVTLVTPGAMYDAKAPFAELIIATDSEVKSAQDLDGKIVGVPYLNDFNELVTKMWVNKHGGNAEDVKFVEIPNTAQVAALEQHRIDAAVLQEPDLAEALATNKVRVLGRAYSAVSPSFMFSAWFARTTWAAKHATLIAAFNRIATQAAAYTNDHPKATAPIMAAATKIPLAVLETMNRTKSATSMDSSTIQPLIDASAAYHFIPRGFAASAMIFKVPSTMGDRS